MHLQNDESDSQVHPTLNDTILSTLLAVVGTAVAIFFGGFTMNYIPNQDVANDTWNLLVAVGAVLVALIGAGLLVKCGKEVRNHLFPRCQLGSSLFKPYANAATASDLCFLVAGIIFSWLAWWERAVFYNEPIHVGLTLVALVTGIYFRHKASTLLGRAIEHNTLIQANQPDTPATWSTVA